MKRAFILLLKILAGLLVFLLIACRLAASRWKGVGCPLITKWHRRRKISWPGLTPSWNSHSV